MILKLLIGLDGSFIYGFIILIAIGPLHGVYSELLGCQLFSIYIEPWDAFPLVLCTLFIIYDIDVIVSKCYPGWLPSKTSWPTMGYSSFIWEDPPNFTSMGLDR